MVRWGGSWWELVGRRGLVAGRSLWEKGADGRMGLVGGGSWWELVGAGGRLVQICMLDSESFVSFLPPVFLQPE